MVNEASELGELLKLPNLEEKTIILINEKMREFIEKARPLSGAEIDARKQDLKGFFDEYIHGVQGGG